MSDYLKRERDPRLPPKDLTDQIPFELPQWAATVSMEDDLKYLKHPDKESELVAEIYAVAFCPFQPLDADQVFAVVSKKHIVLYRLSKSEYAKGDSLVTPINIIRDDDNSASNACCTWVQDPSNGLPYLCVAGRDGIVKIYDLKNSRLVETYPGHGGDINQLTTSPVDPSIFASASDDATVRIWSIDPVHQEQPCLCILGGEGHIAQILTAAFHDGGQYLISGGHDHRINLWTLPKLPTEPVDTPIVVHYPHFQTSAIHGGIIDCVAFYGDYILSRGCHDNVIVLWEIIGFSSEDPPPPDNIAPLPHIPQHNDGPDKQYTRSAFVPAVSAQCPLQYDRRMQFHTPDCREYFFIRFQLYHQPNDHPILTCSNIEGDIFFWDLERIRAYNIFMTNLHDPLRDRRKRIQVPRWLLKHNQGNGNGKALCASSSKAVSDISSRSSQVTTDENVKEYVYDQSGLDPKLLQSWKSMYAVQDRDHPLEPHRKQETKMKGGRPFVGRQATWSPGGEWCVVAGSLNLAIVLRRWSKKTDLQP